MLCVYNYIDLFAAQCPNIDYFDTNCGICKQKHSSVKSSIIIFLGEDLKYFVVTSGGDPKKMEILKIFNHPPPPPLINNERSLKVDEMSKSAICSNINLQRVFSSNFISFLHL